MTIGNTSVKTIDQTGITESNRYARDLSVSESMGLSAGQFVPPQVELRHVVAKPTELEQEPNFFVPPAQTAANFSLPKNWSDHRRPLFGTCIAETWTQRNLEEMFSTLSISEPSNPAQVKQKSTIAVSISKLTEKNGEMIAIRNNIGRMRQG